ncbi:carbon-nitrogen hydrolase family protein [Canibacter zhoujuaniae]|uniref:carbon-nitrogen hydrolase family protein n=1 Tax=Canibacter zhoujuaniae TaxID=2708343 RepID=UPI0014233127|nr:carbon-nitrogen hydrolase family protein [Canibacter zhoujuaniae]
MTGKLTIGLAQRHPLPFGSGLPEFAADVAATLAAHPQINLLVYPEMHLHDAHALPEAQRDSALRSLAVSLKSDFIREIGAVAQQHKIWLVPGSIGEITAGGKYYNTELVFDPQGNLVTHYRKMFPWRPDEPHDYGTEFVTFNAERIEFGLSNCYDSWFPEHTRQLAWLGSDVILNVVKTTTPDREQELVLARANAIANQVYFLSINCAGPIGQGKSIAVGPEGEVLAQAGTDQETLVVAVDTEINRRVRRLGTAGATRPWSHFHAADPEIPLPMYGGAIRPAHWQPKKHHEK